MSPQIQLTHRQHKVPRWHLKNFSDANGNLWCYSRNMNAVQRKPKSVCWEIDFYEYELHGYATGNKYERWLGKIENDAATKCQEILRGAQLGRRDAAVWAAYVASLFVRSPKCREQIRSAMTSKFKLETRGGEFIRELQHGLLKKGHLVPADELRGIVESRRSDMERSPSYYHLAGMMSTSKSLAESLLKRTWHTLKPDAGSAFLLGDCPVITIGLEGNRLMHGSGFNNENASVILPLTPQNLFVASPPAHQWRPELTSQQVEQLNLLTVRYARDMVVSSANAPQITALVNREINQVTFGRDAFVPRN